MDPPPPPEGSGPELGAQFGNRVSFTEEGVRQIVAESQAIGKGNISLGQRSLQKKVSRPGNKFELEPGIPSQAQVEEQVRRILTSPNVAIKKVAGRTSALPDGGFKVRANGPNSPGLLLDLQMRFVGFAN